MSWFTGTWEGLDLSGDFLNVRYAGRCTGGGSRWVGEDLVPLVDPMPDCGHVTCGLLCDVLLVQVRRRRKAAARRVGRQGR